MTQYKRISIHVPLRQKTSNAFLFISSTIKPFVLLQIHHVASQHIYTASRSSHSTFSIKFDGTKPALLRAQKKNEII